MNNLEWLYEHDRDKLVKLLTGEYISCDMCYYCHDYPDCGGDCERNVREWLDDVHSEQIPDNENAALDSREKLKGDAYHLMCDTWNKGLMFAKRPYEDIPLDAVMWKFGDMLNLLNRQAAITERETEKKWSCFSDSAGGHITELSREIGTLRAERDHYRELCGKLLDAADDMRRVRDAFDQFERGEA